MLRTVAVAAVAIGALLIATPSAHSEAIDRGNASTAFVAMPSGAHMDRAPAHAQEAISASAPAFRAFGLWKAFDCVVALAGFIVGNSVLVLKVKKAGGSASLPSGSGWPVALSSD